MEKTKELQSKIVERNPVRRWQTDTAKNQLKKSKQDSIKKHKIIK